MADRPVESDWVTIAGACRDAVNRAPHGDKVEALREAAEGHGLSDSHVRRMIRALTFVEALDSKDMEFALALRRASFRVAELVDRWSQFAPSEAKAAAQRYFDKEVNFKGLQTLFERESGGGNAAPVSTVGTVPDEFRQVAFERAEQLAGRKVKEVSVEAEPRLAAGVDRLMRSSEGHLFAVLVTPPGLSPKAYAVRRKLDAGRIALHKRVGIETIVVLPEEAEPSDFAETLSIYGLQDTPVGVIRVRPQYYAE